jgi:transposase
MLIEMVFEKGTTAYKAAGLLGINRSTAKAIVRQFRRKGSIFQRKN